MASTREGRRENTSIKPKMNEWLKCVKSEDGNKSLIKSGLLRSEMRKRKQKVGTDISKVEESQTQ